MKWLLLKHTNLLAYYIGSSRTPLAPRPKNLYIFLVRSKLLYCSPLRRPYLLKDIESLEKVQWRATKFILSNYQSDYKIRLIQSGMLLLMYIYEIADILFFIKSIKNPSDLNLTSITMLQALQGLLTQSYTPRQPIQTLAIMNSYLYRLATQIVEFFTNNWLIPIRWINQIKVENIFLESFLVNFDNSPCRFHYLCPCTLCSKTPAPTNYNHL